MSHRTWVEISQGALRSNIAALCSLLSAGVELGAVVKANAYGHGLKEIVTLIREAGVRTFCVDHVDEGLKIRQIIPAATIIVIGYTLHDRLPDVIQAQLDQTVYDLETIRRLQELSKGQGQKARVHLKIETGTNRQGLGPEQIRTTLEEFRRSPDIELVGLSTHFANIEEADDATFAQDQMKRFAEAKAAVLQAGFLPPLIHTAGSAAMILYPKIHATLVRPGIALYGFWPSRETRQKARLMGRWIELEPVLSWKTKIAQVKEAPIGATVGYGCTEKLRRFSKLAVIPIGYWDGYDRRLSSCGEMIIRGHLCRVLGRVCMNMCMVDVTEVPKVSREDEVIVIGRAGKSRMRSEDLADRINSIHYEVTTRINSLIPRLIVS